MSQVMNNGKCWYAINDDGFKVDVSNIPQFDVFIDKCVCCGYSITSLSYQQMHCGSRYCSSCYQKLDDKYYCLNCKEDDVNNFIHKKLDIFIDKALKKDLEKMNIKCPDCNLEIKFLFIEQHALHECISRWYKCSECGLLHKNQLDCQKDTEVGQSSVSSKESCPECGEEYSKNEIHKCIKKLDESSSNDSETEFSTEHSEDYKLNRLDKTWAIMKSLKMTDCKKQKDSREYAAWFDYCVEKLKNLLNYDVNEVKLLYNEIKSLRKGMDEEKDIFESIKTELLNKISDIHNTSFDGILVWRIDNFKEIRKNAIDGLEKSIFSLPFYTSRFGYKMCLQLYPNGVPSVAGVSMSLFLVIMQGKYDAMLKWPFKQLVKFIIIDPELKNNHLDYFQPSENMASFCRPKTDMNVPSGIVNFITFDKMNRNKFQFAKNNTLFIKCVVDCSNLHE